MSLASDFSQETVFGSFMTTRLHMSLSGTTEDYELETITEEKMLTLIHEHMHFFQALFTGFSQVAWEMHRQMTGFLSSEWQKMSPLPAIKHRLPLAHLARISPKHLGQSIVTHHTAMYQIYSGRARFFSPKSEVTMDDLALEFTQGDWHINPTIMVEGNPHVLQGKEVIEGHAHFVEFTAAINQYGFSPESMRDKTVTPPMYWIALEWFLETCGESRIADFPFICDLALQTSIEPVVCKTEAQWQSVSPSWRFVRLAEELKTRPHISFADPTMWQDNYILFADELLGSCGYKLLGEIMKERIAAFDRKPGLLEIDKLMRSGMVFRLEHPWCGGNPAANLELLERMMNDFPAPIIELEGRLGSFTRKYGNALLEEFIMELHFQAFAAQILGETSSEARRGNQLECAFAKYGMDNGCEYQRSDGCPGRFKPEDGAPFPSFQNQDGTLGGCSFEPILIQLHLSKQDLEIDYSAPALPKIKK